MKKDAYANGFPGGGPVQHPDDGLGFGDAGTGVGNSTNVPPNHNHNFTGPWSGNNISDGTPFTNRVNRTLKETSTEDLIQEIKALIKINSRESIELAKQLKNELDQRISRLQRARRAMSAVKTAQQISAKQAVKEMPFTRALFAEHDVDVDLLDDIQVDFEQIPQELLHYALHEIVEDIKQAQTAQPIKGKCPESGKWVYLSQSDMVQNNHKVQCPEGKIHKDKLKNKKPVSVKEYQKKKKTRKKKKSDLNAFVKEAGLPEKIELLKKKYEDKLLSTLRPERGRLPVDEFLNDLFKWIVAEDPTPKKKYIEWIVRQVADGYQEEDEEFRDLLIRFEEAKKSKKIPTDINAYKTVGQLYDAIEEVEAEFGEGWEAGAPVVLDQSPYRVIRLDSFKASQKLCKGTEWCVRAPRMYQQYASQGPLYYIEKSGQPYALAHFESGQFMDPSDSPLRGSRFKEVINLLSPISGMDYQQFLTANVEEPLLRIAKSIAMSYGWYPKESLEEVIEHNVGERWDSQSRYMGQWPDYISKEDAVARAKEIYFSDPDVQRIADKEKQRLDRKLKEKQEQSNPIEASIKHGQQQRSLQFSPAEQRILDKVKEAAESIGAKAYLVGGAVRDRLLGKENADLDFMVEGADNAAEQLALELVEKHNLDSPVKYDRSQAINVVVDDQALDLINAERVFAPLQDADEDSLEGEEEFTTSFDDAFRRDLTINALMYDLSTGKVLDPTGKGLKDIRSRTIRTIISPFVKYKIHATDMLRALRFAATLGFDLAPDMLEAMKQNAQRVTPRDKGGDISNRRIRRELRKAIDNPTHWATLRDLLTQAGLDQILAEDIQDVQQDFDGSVEYHWSDEEK